MVEKKAPRVLLIGWDAADWQVISPLMEEGLMPNLARMVENGVMGNISTLSPILSPILWNSIATGKFGDRHGILGFVEPDGKGGVRPVCSTSRKAKAIWNIASQNGLRSNVVNWYASHPSEKINGCVLSERFCRIGELQAEYPPCDEYAIYPASLRDAMLELRVSANDISEEQILPFIPQASRIKQPEDQRLAGFCLLLAECSTVHNAATWLMEHEPWEFMAVYYDMIDVCGHAFMEYQAPKMPHISDEDFEIYKEVMTGCYLWHDMMLGRLIELAGPETTVMIVSDHGFHNDDSRPQIDLDESQPGAKFGPGLNPISWHRRLGVFCASGPNIKKDSLVFGASLLDVAPTVLAALGLAVPKDMDGKPLMQIFESPVQPTEIETYEPEHAEDGVHRGERADDPYAEQVALERLIALGYIEAIGDDQAKAVERTILDNKHNLAQIYSTTGRPEKALPLYEELKLADDSPSLRSRLAMCLIDLGRFDQAEAMLTEPAQDPVNHPIAAMLYAKVLSSDQNREDEALKILKVVQETNVWLSPVHLYIGKIYISKAQFELAEAAFRRALELDPEEPEALDGLGVALRGLGRTEDAVFEHMRSASILHARAETHLNLGIALAELKQVDWAIQAFKVAAELAPAHPFPHRCLAKLYNRGKNDIASAHHHAAVASRLHNELLEKGVDPGDQHPVPF